MIANFRAALRGFLLSDPSISAVVGTRIYPTVLPQGVTDPSIVYNRVTGLGDHHMQGASGLTRPRFQIDAYATDPDVAAALADLLKERLDGFKGVMEGEGSPPAAVVNVQGVFFETERDDYQSESALYRVSRDYLIFYGER